MILIVFVVIAPKIFSLLFAIALQARRATIIAIAIVGRVITKRGVTDKKKRLRATTFAIATLEQHHYM